MSIPDSVMDWPTPHPRASGPNSHQDVRIANMSLVLRALFHEPALSRTGIVATTGLSKATVSSLVAELFSRGLLEEGSFESHGGVGRPGQALHLAAGAASALGLEIGIDSLLLTTVNLAGDVTDQRAATIHDAERRPEAVIAQAAAMLAERLEALAATGTLISGIVIAQTGVLDYEHGSVRLSSGLGWRDVSLVPALETALTRLLPPSLPTPAIQMEHDAKLGALAVYAHYAPRGIEHLLYLSCGDGVGAGLIADSHLLRGWLGATGEVGHMPIRRTGSLCRCGRQGCWETVIGLRAVTALYPADDPIHGELSLEERTALLRQRFEAGDAALAAQLEEVGEALIQGLAILTDVMNPQVIVLSGWLAAFGDVFTEPATRALRARRLDERALVTVEASPLGPWAPSQGAALVALERILADPSLTPLA